MIITNAENSFDDIFDIAGDEFGEQLIAAEDIENFIDSRLDVDSVLIDDIKLEHETSASVYNEQSCDFNISEIKEENVKESDEESSLGSVTASPQQRDRCNTWPRILLERPLSHADTWHTPQAGPGLACVSEEAEAAVTMDTLDPGEAGDTAEAGGGHGPGSVYGRRNPWGNQSYADLITQAISSGADKRMTLSQIYDWMVAHIPYFSDRQSNSKSAGWKNSIRHNLSLHQKFVKIPNEGAGKSSWWTLNLENTQVRKPRRRATSGDVKMLSSRREKARVRADSFKHPDKLSRSFSSSGMPPLMSKNLLQASTSLPSASFDPSGAFSTFRSRNLSTTSTTSQDSNGFNMEDLVNSELGNIWTEDSPPGDLGTFSMSGLNVQQQQQQQIQHQLQPHLDQDSGHQKQKLKILEPRDCPLTNVPQQFTFPHDQEDDIPAMASSADLTPTSEMMTMKMYDEERRQMIVQQLEILNNRKMTENADVDNSILLLEEQLELMVRRSELVTKTTEASEDVAFSNPINANSDISTGLCDFTDFYNHF